MAREMHVAAHGCANLALNAFDRSSPGVADLRHAGTYEREDLKILASS